jgi:PAS domain S-box-containing protein
VDAREPDYREIVERIGDMIYTLDLEGNFTYLNSAGLALMGFSSADELLGRHFTSVLTPRSAAVASDHFARGLGMTESTPFFEVQVVRSDGQLVDVEVRAGNLHGDDGELVGRQGVARDISALKALQAQVAEKSERIALIEGQTRVAMDLYRRIGRDRADAARRGGLADPGVGRQARARRAGPGDRRAARPGLLEPRDRRAGAPQPEHGQGSRQQADARPGRAQPRRGRGPRGAAGADRRMSRAWRA